MDNKNNASSKIGAEKAGQANKNPANKPWEARPANKEEALNGLANQKDSVENEETKKLKLEMAELVDILKRVQAEFENYRKRVERDKAEFIKNSKRDLICDILPVLDTFEIALKSCSSDENVAKGFKLIYTQLISLLEKEGVKQVSTEKFDPCFHEPLMEEESDQDGKILEVLQKGYCLHDRILRTAKVKISKARNINKK